MVFTFEQEREIEDFLVKKISSYFNNFDDELLKSDEIGHSHAPGVQKKVGTLLSELYEVSYETNKKGKKKKRAFSDNLIMGNPNNVKFGVSVGQPNLVSMNRMITNVIEHNLSCYYVTIVFYDRHTKQIKIKFVNILQFMDCLAYNAGPGQIMLKQEKFNKEYEKYIKGERNVINKKDINNKLIDLYVTEIDKHVELRQKQKEKILKLKIINSNI